MSRLEKKEICHVTVTDSDESQDANTTVEMDFEEDHNVIISADDIKDIVATNIAAKEALSPKEKKKKERKKGKRLISKIRKKK